MQVPLLVAADLLPPGVDDIDEEEDPQVVSDNVKHIYAYLRQMEDKYAIPKVVVYRIVKMCSYSYIVWLFRADPFQEFLRHSSITPRMRSILINWLAQVSLQFKLLPETLYLTVEIIDRFLSLQGSTSS